MLSEFSGQVEKSRPDHGKPGSVCGMIFDDPAIDLVDLIEHSLVIIEDFVDPRSGGGLKGDTDSLKGSKNRQDKFTSNSSDKT